MSVCGWLGHTLVEFAQAVQHLGQLGGVDGLDRHFHDGLVANTHYSLPIHDEVYYICVWLSYSC